MTGEVLRTSERIRRKKLIMSLETGEKLENLRTEDQEVEKTPGLDQETKENPEELFSEEKIFCLMHTDREAVGYNSHHPSCLMPACMRCFQVFSSLATNWANLAHERKEMVFSQVMKRFPGKVPVCPNCSILISADNLFPRVFPLV